jgi:hypothetical protein
VYLIATYSLRAVPSQQTFLNENIERRSENVRDLCSTAPDSLGSNWRTNAIHELYMRVIDEQIKL